MAGRWRPGDCQAAEIALDVHEQGRNTGFGELLGDHLERLGFSGAGRAGDEAVTIHGAQGQADLAPRRKTLPVTGRGAEQDGVALK